MALKIIVLLFLALTITKACDLDWILEDIYDDSDSSEDESTEKPDKPNNKPTSAPPSPESSITTKPFPIIPVVADNAPPNNSTPASNSSRVMDETSTGNRRRRTTHHRRRILRRIPTGHTLDSKTNEGRSFDTDQTSFFGDFTPLFRKTLVQEKRNTEEETRSFTDRDFIDDKLVPFIELPEGRIGNLDLDHKKDDDFFKVFIAPLERRNIEEKDEFVPVFEIPQGRMENLELGESDNEEGQVETEDSMEDEEEGETRSMTDNDSLEDVMDGYLEMPRGRMEGHGFRRNIKKAEQSEMREFMKYLMDRNERNNMRKYRPHSRFSKSDMKKYMREYIKMLILRDIEGKIENSNDYVYVPIPKAVLNKHQRHRLPLPPNKHKGYQMISIINRKYLLKRPERPEVHIRPSLMEAWLYNKKPAKPKPMKNQGEESIIVLISKGSSKKPEEKNPDPITQHLMLQSQNPRRPILNPADSDIHSLVDDSPERKSPSINHVNQVKEHILRETIKINPKDNSEIHNLHEQTRLSIIKSPHGPIELTLEKNDPADLKDSKEEEKKSEEEKKPEVQEKPYPIPSDLFVQEPPLMNTKDIHFHEKYPESNMNHETHKPQKLLYQELPFVHIEKNFHDGYFDHHPHMHSLSNKFGEGHEVSNSKDESKPESATMMPGQSGLAPQEENFYVKPQTPEKDQPKQNEPPLPLVDMLDKFKGQNMERPATSSPVKKLIVNAVKK